MSDEPTLQEYFDFALKLVQKATQHFLRSREETITAVNKTDDELVTDYDKSIEKLLIRKIATKYPNHKFIAEESSATEPSLTDDPTWIIDPIDGTTNFSRKIPLSGISVALVLVKAQAIGIVSIPFLGETYTAIKGKGAFLNGRPIRCSDVTELKRSLVCYEIVSSEQSSIAPRISCLMKHVFAMRSFGCPVLSQCYVACGKLDAYQGDGLRPWDAAAGTLIVREAGGCVVEPSGEPFDLMRPNFLVTSTNELCQKYVEIIRLADDKL